MIQLIEERAMAAWPALETLVSDGWVLRFAGGYTRRANSVLPLHATARSLDVKIEEAERLYRARRLAPTFKMTSESRPDGLDSALAERGYIEEARTSVQVADLSCGQDGGVRVETSWSKSGPWRDAFHRMGDVAAGRRALHDRILASISLPSAFASVEESGRIVGCALGVVQDGWLGVFDVVVDGGARRRGHGERLMRGLMAWARELGASQSYLQVMLDNAPALALYRKLGFREAYQYWYRVRDLGDRGSPVPAVGFGFSFQAAQGGDVLIRRGGRIVTHLRNDAAREFLADVDGACFEDEQLLMARYTGNYKHGNEREARQHPRHRA